MDMRAESGGRFDNRENEISHCQHNNAQQIVNTSHEFHPVCVNSAITGHPPKGESQGGIQAMCSFCNGIFKGQRDESYESEVQNRCDLQDFTLQDTASSVGPPPSLTRLQGLYKLKQSEYSDIERGKKEHHRQKVCHVLGGCGMRMSMGFNSKMMSIQVIKGSYKLYSTLGQRH